MAFLLERWSEAHWQGFAAMQSDPAVMADLGGAFSKDASREKFERYRNAWTDYGISRWAVVSEDGDFLGYSGIMFCSVADHPLGSHYEIGWRFRRSAWGKGLATLSARKALDDAWSHLNAEEILSYTAADNFRSQNVMGRLGLTRDARRDFTASYAQGRWTGLVWFEKRPDRWAEG